jgi:hypothetical protein
MKYILSKIVPVKRNINEKTPMKCKISKATPMEHKNQQNNKQET